MILISFNPANPDTDKFLNVINPLLVNSISGNEVFSFVEMIVKNFYCLTVFQHEISVASFAATFGKAQRLPANQYDAVSGCTADTIGVNGSGQGLTFHLYPAYLFVGGGLPQLFSDFLKHYVIFQFTNIDRLRNEMSVVFFKRP